MLFIFSLTAIGTPPVPVLVSPVEGTLTTCEDEEVHIDLSSGEDMDISTIVFRVDGDSWTLDNEELELADEILYFRPSGYYTYTTGTVNICLDPIADIHGAWSDEICWNFDVDLDPPVMSNESPTGMVTAFSFPISMDITDNMLPLDLASISVEIIAGGVTTTVTNADDFARWEAPTFSFSSADCGAPFADGQTVTVRLMVRDLPPATSDCAGNLLDTSWTFTLSETPCDRYPNPITPGIRDRVNDDVIFQFPNMRKTGADIEIYIYDLKGNEVALIDKRSVVGDWRWDGTDTNGDQLGQGTYIYLIRVDGETMCNGTITIAR